MSTNHDALGYIDELQEVTQSQHMQFFAAFGGSSGDVTEAQWQTVSQLVEADLGLQAAANRIVSSLGFCRLYGIALPTELQAKLSSPLPVALLIAAVVNLLRIIRETTADAKALPTRFDAVEPLEDRDHCASILFLLMEVWAMYIVIDDEYQLELDRREIAGTAFVDPQFVDSPFGVRMQRMVKALLALDAATQADEQIKLLSTVTELSLLENWRQMLVEPYRDPLPWFLDGTLETAAKQVLNEVLTAKLT